MANIELIGRKFIIINYFWTHFHCKAIISKHKLGLVSRFAIPVEERITLAPCGLHFIHPLVHLEILGELLWNLTPRYLAVLCQSRFIIIHQYLLTLIARMGMSLVYVFDRTGDNTAPCGRPDVIEVFCDKAVLILTWKVRLTGKPVRLWASFLFPNLFEDLRDERDQSVTKAIDAKFVDDRINQSERLQFCGVLSTNANLRVWFMLSPCNLANVKCRLETGFWAVFEIVEMSHPFRISLCPRS